eukprot:UN2639
MRRPSWMTCTANANVRLLITSSMRSRALRNSLLPADAPTVILNWSRAAASEKIRLRGFSVMGEQGSERGDPELDEHAPAHLLSCPPGGVAMSTSTLSMAVNGELVDCPSHGKSVTGGGLWKYSSQRLSRGDATCTPESPERRCGVGINSI